MSDPDNDTTNTNHHTTNNHHQTLAYSLPAFKQTCSSLILSLPSKYPNGIQLNGTWKPIHQKSHQILNPKTRSQETFQATLYGKRSSHGGQSTRGGFRDPVTPTTARIQVPIPNPSITTLMSYVEGCMERQIEERDGEGEEWLRTKRFQVDTHLTVYFEWVKEGVGEIER